MTERPPTALAAMLAEDEAHGVDVHAFEAAPERDSAPIAEDPPFRPEPPEWVPDYRRGAS